MSLVCCSNDLGDCQKSCAWAFTAKGRNGLLAPKQDAETVSAFFEDMCSLLLVVSDGLLEIIDTRLG